MAKRKIVGYFQITKKISDETQKNVVYFLVAERKAWDESGEMEDFLDEKIYKALPDEFTEHAECVFESPYNVENTIEKLRAAGFDAQELVDDIEDWV